MASNEEKNKNTVPAKKLKQSILPDTLEECLAVEDKIPFKKDVVFHDDVLKVVVRVNDFGVKEILDYDSYLECLRTEKHLNKELEVFLNDTSPMKRKNN